MRRGPLLLGLALLPVGWALAPLGMTGHMAGHMIAVALAAPALALAMQGSRLDPVRRLPRLATPLLASLVEAAVVWGWHVPALRRLADHALPWLALEQASFLAAGLLLWAAVLAPGHRAQGVAALLVTSMHMTLLGALIGLAPRPLYAMAHGHGTPFGLDALADQQLAGVVMLLIGGVAYLAGGLAMLATLLSSREAHA